ncbi:TonB-dependent receptor [Sphingomonas sp. S2-65]|uniref:TonB-dependent receptor n=1 Tax=Sphingomonas sp. S2-65 TaxID=2903960 RepID=UPI001F1B0EEF|nr:TonB-dependent receptor [Sphingomonas sp. S2-65]UYY57852.1 TonB-dependent receptor [Sphingomonas sp. S2-65]
MLRSLLLASAALISAPALANEVPAPSETTAPATAPADQDHQQPAQEIVVTGARPRATADVLGGVTVLANEELTREMRSTIGETLARQPGVSATSFGPNASRPVLRGFVGARAPLLIDGIGSIDVSNTSADHAPVINPLTADRIEVLRGPTALIFGPSAIGGVVNVIDSRIPRRLPEEAVHVDGIATYGSAADERSVSGAIDVPAAGKIVLHADGSYTKTNDQNTGGHVLSRELRRQAAASAVPEIQELADLKGKVPNTAAETWEVAGGAAIVDERGNLGVSVSHFDSLYGVPVRYSLDPAVEAEKVRLHVKQDRFDLRGEVNTGDGFLRQIRLRAAAADYRHQEIEDTGEVGTTFFSQGYEGRLELVQRATDTWDGIIGGQFSIRDMHVVGEEKFLPKNEAQQFGAFTLQSLDFGALKAEAALRYEHNQLTAQADADIGNPAYARSFDSLSGSLGASYALAPNIRLGVNASRSERAPTPEELFANGPHAGTQAFEIGNPDFTTEKAWGVEATLKGAGEGWSFSTAAYYNWFSDYIFDAPTGQAEDGLPIFQYNQADARYYGFEAEGSLRLGQIGGFKLNADALADYVHAEIVDGGPVPRIPPLRLMGGLEAQSDRFNARVEVEHDFEQERIAAFETPTRGFTLVNASVAWKPWGTASNTTLLLSANNLFDVEARRHTSVLKDYAPLAGRDLRATLRVQI